MSWVFAGLQTGRIWTIESTSGVETEIWELPAQSSKEVMKVNKQEKNSKPGEIFRENGKALPLKVLGGKRVVQGSSLETQAAGGEDRKTHPLG